MADIASLPEAVILKLKYESNRIFINLTLGVNGNWWEWDWPVHWRHAVQHGWWQEDEEVLEQVHRGGADNAGGDRTAHRRDQLLPWQLHGCLLQPCQDWADVSDDACWKINLDFLHSWNVIQNVRINCSISNVSFSVLLIQFFKISIVLCLSEVIFVILQISLSLSSSQFS